MLGVNLVRSNEDRLNRQARDVPEGTLYYLVFNASGIQVENVWVRGADDRSLRIGAVQRCTMYELPLGFVAIDLYLTDSLGRWHRSRDGGLDNDFAELLGDDTDNPYWWDTLDNCPG